MRPTAHESWLSVWGRRALSIPLYLSLTAVLFGLAPLWFFATLLIDGISASRATLPRTRALAFFAVYLGCEVVGILGATLLWLFTLGGRAVGSETYVEENAALQRWWTGTLLRGAIWAFSMKVETEGLSLAQEGPILLFVRHASTADTVLAAAFVANPNQLLLRYVVKRELLWDPCLDLVGRRLPNAFINRSAAEVQAVAALARGLGPRSGVLIYPEGTRFSEEKRPRALAALREKKLDALSAIAEGFSHVLPPRLGGALALIEAAPGVDVVFLEHTGFEGAATFASFWGGGLIGKTLRVRLRRFAANDIPVEARDAWLFREWAEVDRWVGEARTSKEDASK